MAVDHIVPTFKGYTDVDVYGRGSDSVFGKGAEAQNALEAKRILAATRFAKANIRPQDVIDYDLYGRGDPRVFGKGSETINKLEAEKQLKENQNKNKYRLRGLMFKSHAIELVKVGMGRLRKVPSIRAARREDSNSKETETQPAAVQERNAPKVEKQWSTSSPASTPKRVTSRLPSEEVRPAVEAGAVLRAIKSYSEDDDLRSALPDDQASGDMEVAIDLEDDAGPSTTTALAIDPRALTKEGSRIGDIKYNKNDRGVVVPKLSTASSRSVFEPKEMNALVPPEEGAFDAAVSSEEKAVEMSSSEQDEEMESTSGESERSSSVVEEETSSEEVGAHEEVSETYEDDTVALRRRQTSDQSASEEEEVESSTSEEQENSSDDIEVTSEDEEMEDVDDEDGKRSDSYEGSSPQESSSDVEITETDLGANVLPSKGLGDIQNATSPTTPARQEVEEFPNEESRVERRKSIADRMALFENAATPTEPKMVPSNDSVSAPADFSRTQDGLQERNMPSSHSRQDIVASDSNYSAHTGPGVLEDDAFVTENMVLDEEELTRKISYHEVESTQIIPIAREKSVTFATNQNQVEDEAGDARGTDQSPASASEENTGFWSRLNFFRARSTTSPQSMSREGSGKSDGVSEDRDSTNAGPMPLGESLDRNPSLAERIASFASQSGNNAPTSSAQVEPREPAAAQSTSEDSRTTSDEVISTSDSNVHSADSDEEMEDSDGDFDQSQSSSAVEDLSSEDTSAAGATSESEPTVSTSEAAVTSSEPSVSSSEPAVSSSEPAIEDSTEPSNAEEDDFVQAI